MTYYPRTADPLRGLRGFPEPALGPSLQLSPASPHKQTLVGNILIGTHNNTNGSVLIASFAEPDNPTEQAVITDAEIAFARSVSVQWPYGYVLSQNTGNAGRLTRINLDNLLRGGTWTGGANPVKVNHVADVTWTTVPEDSDIVGNTIFVTNDLVPNTRLSAFDISNAAVVPAFLGGIVLDSDGGASNASFLQCGG